MGYELSAFPKVEEKLFCFLVCSVLLSVLSHKPSQSETNNDDSYVSFWTPLS